MGGVHLLTVRTQDLRLESLSTRQPFGDLARLGKVLSNEVPVTSSFDKPYVISVNRFAITLSVEVSWYVALGRGYLDTHH